MYLLTKLQVKVDQGVMATKSYSTHLRVLHWMHFIFKQKLPHLFGGSYSSAEARSSVGVFYSRHNSCFFYST